MKKIPTLFLRDAHHLVTPDVKPGLEWVLNGDGIASRKYDGTCCRLLGGWPWKRRTVKPHSCPPDGFEQCQTLDDGGRIGWVPCYRDAPEDEMYWDAMERLPLPRADGTYELCGPAVNGNHDNIPGLRLIRHGVVKIHALNTGQELTFEFLKTFLGASDIEGVVWRHKIEPLWFAKLKRRDFGFAWPLTPGATTKAEKEIAIDDAG